MVMLIDLPNTQIMNEHISNMEQAVADSAIVQKVSEFDNQALDNAFIDKMRAIGYKVTGYDPSTGNVMYETDRVNRIDENHRVVLANLINEFIIDTSDGKFNDADHKGMDNFMKHFLVDNNYVNADSVSLSGMRFVSSTTNNAEVSDFFGNEQILPKYLGNGNRVEVEHGTDLLVRFGDLNEDTQKAVKDSYVAGFIKDLFGKIQSTNGNIEDALTSGNISRREARDIDNNLEDIENNYNANESTFAEGLTRDNEILLKKIVEQYTAWVDNLLDEQASLRVTLPTEDSNFSVFGAGHYVNGEAPVHGAGVSYDFKNGIIIDLSAVYFPGNVSKKVGTRTGEPIGPNGDMAYTQETTTKTEKGAVGAGVAASYMIPINGTLGIGAEIGLLYVPTTIETLFKKEEDIEFVGGNVQSNTTTGGGDPEDSNKNSFYAGLRVNKKLSDRLGISFHGGNSYNSKGKGKVSGGLNVQYNFKK